MENEMDMAHPTFVHTTTFGSEEHPLPESMELKEIDILWDIIHAHDVTADAHEGVIDTTIQYEIGTRIPFYCKLLYVNSPLCQYYEGKM